MGLPIVSMEDEELFPKHAQNLYEPPDRFIAEEKLEKFLNEPDQLWWSRLIISARGYVVNINEHTEEQLFSIDDAFVFMHKVFAERNIRLTPAQFIAHLNTLFSMPDVLDLLNRVDPANSGYLEPNPFHERASPVARAFEDFFGSAESAQNLHTANLQKLAYDVLARLLGVLHARYNVAEESSPTSNGGGGGSGRRGIRFAKDADWQPDDRVVLFREFYKGNRTWILSDFDRHVLEFWKPNGVQVIFGDAYVDKKRRAGLHLCDHCGMLEQLSGQFPQYHDKRFCTEHCFAALLDRHR